MMSWFLVEIITYVKVSLLKEERIFQMLEDKVFDKKRRFLYDTISFQKHL
jgi:hypothetical protein